MAAHGPGPGRIDAGVPAGENLPASQLLVSLLSAVQLEGCLMFCVVTVPSELGWAVTPNGRPLQVVGTLQSFHSTSTMNDLHRSVGICCKILLLRPLPVIKMKNNVATIHANKSSKGKAGERHMADSKTNQFDAFELFFCCKAHQAFPGSNQFSV